jgi:hypothetical protein
VGTLKGGGRIYQQTFLATYSKVAFAKLSDRKTSLTAADFLNDQVVPFCDAQGVPLSRVLTARGTEYCGSPDTHEYELDIIRNKQDLRLKAENSRLRA